MYKTHFSWANNPERIDLVREMARCSQCGICLSQCPTYAVKRQEMFSPRGRLFLMSQSGRDRSPPPPDYLDSCLRCAQCETVCPTGVPFAAIIRDFTLRELDRGVDVWAVEALDCYAEAQADPGLRALLAALLHSANETTRRLAAAHCPEWAPRLADTAPSPRPTGKGEPVVLLAGPLLRAVAPDLVAAVARRLAAADRQVWQFPGRERIALPWVESGLNAALGESVAEFRENLEAASASTVFALEAYAARAVESPLIHSRFQLPEITVLEPSALYDEIRVEGPVVVDVSPFNRAWTDWLETRLDRRDAKLPLELHPAGAYPAVTLSSQRHLARLVRGKRRWLAEFDGELLTGDSLSLLRYPKARSLFEAGDQHVRRP